MKKYGCHSKNKWFLGAESFDWFSLYLFKHILPLLLYNSGQANLKFHILFLMVSPGAADLFPCALGGCFLALGHNKRLPLIVSNCPQWVVGLSVTNTAHRSAAPTCPFRHPSSLLWLAADGGGRTLPPRDPKPDIWTLDRMFGCPYGITFSSACDK